LCWHRTSRVTTASLGRSNPKFSRRSPATAWRVTSWETRSYRRTLKRVRSPGCFSFHSWRGIVRRSSMPAMHSGLGRVPARPVATWATARPKSSLRRHASKRCVRPSSQVNHGCASDMREVGTDLSSRSLSPPILYRVNDLGCAVSPCAGARPFSEAETRVSR